MSLVKTDRTMRAIVLERLWRSLAAYEYEELELELLQPFRDELLSELRKITPGALTGHPSLKEHNESN